MKSSPTTIRKKMLPLLLAVSLAGIGSKTSAQALRQRGGTDCCGDPLPAGALARIGTLRLFDAGPAAPLVFSPDGKWIATPIDFKGVRLWDTTTGAPVRDLVGSQGELFSVALSPPGSLCVAGGTDGIHVWRLDRPSNTPVHRLAGKEEWIRPIVFSPDGKVLAAADSNHVIHLWSVDSWRKSRPIQGPGSRQNHPRNQLAFLPDGKGLISASEDGGIHLWDVATTKHLRVLAEKLKPSCMALSPDGKILAVVDGHTSLHLLDIARGKKISRVSAPRFACITFSPDGKMLASTGGEDETVSFWDTANGKLRRQWKCGRDCYRLTFAPDGKVLALGEGNVIRLRAMDTGREVVPLPGPKERVTAVCFSGDGKTLSTASRDGSTSVWQAETGQAQGAVHPSPYPGPHSWPRLACEGRIAASLDGSKGVFCLWRAQTGEKLRQLGGPRAEDSAFALSGDGRILAAIHTNKILRLWDTASGQVLRGIRVGEAGPGAHALSADGKVAATVDKEQEVHLWDTDNGKELPRLQLPVNPVPWMAVTLSADHRLAACGPVVLPGRAASVCVWEVATGKPLSLLEGGPAPCLAFSPDGRMVAADDCLAGVRVWEVASGRPRCLFDGHRFEILALAFSPDGRRLASGSGDHTAVVWDVTGLGEVKEEKPLSASAREALWNDLLADDAQLANRAVWRLVASRGEAVSLLRERLQAVAPAGAQEVTRLIEQLDSESFARREEAMHALEQLGQQASSALTKAAKQSPFLEVRRRAGQALRKIEALRPPPSELRKLRSLEILEHIGSSAAMQLLEKLSQGAPEARLSREAKASLSRLQRRTATPGH